ncbi:hypothetical protein L6452_32422 [Arctium lappa]|uniref:Uncharacterized protein n=1 Tax=Arctium lappa TaxID=4217 RepID=A0ACB8Z3M3_ARCLA|nr:hypothetical protein L6452_32422 [Arctium lappa]
MNPVPDSLIAFRSFRIAILHSTCASYWVVRFRSPEKPKEDEFSLELSKLNNYDDVVERLAHHLNLDDPSKIRLTSHNCYSQQPKPQPSKYRGVEHLSDMLAHYNQTSDILYYEVLDIPLPELQSLKTLKVAFHHATKDEVVIHTIRLPKQSTVGDVISDLKTKVELSHRDAELRLLEVFYHKIYKVQHVSKSEQRSIPLWDINMGSGPIATFQLCDLYENDSIFDKFECCLSGDGQRVATGTRAGMDFVDFAPSSEKL